MKEILQKRKNMERIFHHYEKWECYKHGFFSEYSQGEINDLMQSVRYVFSSEKITEKWMRLIIAYWPISCEQNLSNLSMNRVAWLGQAACCYYGGVPSKATMYCWKFLNEKTQRRSDNVAKKIIKEWEQKMKLQSTLANGKEEGIQMEFQMKPPTNLNDQD
jgi:hypothetical protein